MIKVQQTRTHNGKLVAEAKLVLVDHKLDLSNTHTPRPLVTHDPILISETEKIEVGDWRYNSNSGIVLERCQYHNEAIACNSNPSTYKVLALPEHFSPQQLKDIVDGKLKDRMLVECIEVNEEYKCRDCGSHITRGYRCKNNKHHDMDFYPGYAKIKLNPHITIYPIEEKMYTRKDVESLTHQLLSEHNSSLPDVYSQMNERELDEYHREWLKENLK